MSNRIEDTAISKRLIISTTKAVKMLNVSPGTIRTYNPHGKLRGYKTGRLVKVDVRR